MFVFLCLGVIFRYLFCAGQQQSLGSNKAEGLALDERNASVSNKIKKVHICFLSHDMSPDTSADGVGFAFFYHHGRWLMVTEKVP